MQRNEMQAYDNEYFLPDLLQRLRSYLEHNIDKSYSRYIAKSSATGGMRGAIYDRCTVDNGHALSDRLDTLFDLAARECIHVPRELVFVDMMPSKRTGLNALGSALTKAGAKALLTTCPDRLSRDQNELVKFMLRMHNRCGTCVMFIEPRMTANNGSTFNAMNVYLRCSIADAST